MLNKTRMTDEFLLRNESTCGLLCTVLFAAQTDWKAAKCVRSRSVDRRFIILMVFRNVYTMIWQFSINRMSKYGLTAFYRGYLFSILGTVPSVAINLSVYEVCAVILSSLEGFVLSNNPSNLFFSLKTVRNHFLSYGTGRKVHKKSSSTPVPVL